jgi:hypothetical protein
MLPAGESITGLVAFEVLAGTEPGMIYYAPGSDRQVRLAEYGEDQAPTPSDTPPTVPNRQSDEDETPVSSADCDGVLEWAEATLPNIETWTEAFSLAFSTEDIAPDTVREAAESLNDAADVQVDIDTPEIAQAANDAFIDVLEQTAEILNDIADAAEAGDDARVTAAIAELTNVGTGEGEGSLTETFDELTAACPDIESVE